MQLFKQFTSVFAIVFICYTSLSAQTFTQITDNSNPIVSSSFPQNYSGAAWIDIENDGDLDLSTTSNSLFRNEGDGTFTSIESGIGSNQEAQTGSGVSWADFDNDGYIDCAIAGNPTTLYRNLGDGTFTEFTGKDVRPDLQYRTWACSWGDYDNDGYVDLVAAHPRGFLGSPIPSLLYKSLGAGAFDRDTLFEFTTELAPYTVATWSDYDLDNDLDLFIGSGPASGTPARDYLYRNMLSETGTASLERIDDQPMGTDLQDGQVWNWIDYDNDGDLDGYITNYGGAPNRFYINNNGTYESVNNELTFNGQYLANTWGDVDNDGDLDVFITGDTDNRFYLNNGDGTFTRVNNVINSQASSVGASLGDYDNDGDLDLFISGQISGLYRNDTENSNSWINISLKGTVSNRSAIGAKVRAKAVINGEPVWQIREVSAQNSFNSQNSLRLHFGFSDAEIVDSVIVYWPSGGTTVSTELAVNQFLEFTESLPDDIFRINFTADSTNAFNKDSVTVQFFDISLTGSGNSIISRQWDFNEDGIIDSENPNPVYTFKGRGEKSITFIASTATQTDTLSIKNYVYVSGKFPVISADLNAKLIGTVYTNETAVDDTFYVFNDGDGSDSISVTFDYTNITKDSGLVAIPQKFEIAPHDTQMVIFRIIPALVEPVGQTIRLNLVLESKFNLGTRQFNKVYQFRIKVPTAVEKSDEVPLEFSLSQNYPNPFNPATTIKFQITENAFTTLKVYDLLGKEVASPESKVLSAGSYSIGFNGSNLSSGTYFYRLQSGLNTITKKFLLLK